MTWRDRAACLGADPELFFNERHHHDAIAICQQCDVKAKCLDDAVQNELFYGVFGGLIAEDRKKIKRKENPTLRVKQGCGTLAGYVRHIKNKQEACDPCRKAKRDYSRERYRKKNAA